MVREHCAWYVFNYNCIYLISIKSFKDIGGFCLRRADLGLLVFVWSERQDRLSSLGGTNENSEYIIIILHTAE